MTNEELQTLIANSCKAAGLTIARWIDGMPQLASDTHQLGKMWNPRDDDGDSRMLQVACKIALHFEVIGGEWFEEAYSQDDADGNAHCAYEPLKDDAKKAACMAVLRCASMIGEAME